jgi:hypothetical protein
MAIKEGRRRRRRERRETCFNVNCTNIVLYRGRGGTGFLFSPELHNPKLYMVEMERVNFGKCQWIPTHTHLCDNNYPYAEEYHTSYCLLYSIPL